MSFLVDRPSGELFPLPLVQQEDIPRSSLSRGTKQRVCRRRAVDMRVNGAVRSLNWLSGCGSAGQHRSALHDQVLDHVREVMVRTAPEGAIPQPHEAARALLRSRAGYDPDDQSVCDYQEDLVSVPASCLDCPLAVDVVPEPAREMLVNFESHMVLPVVNQWEADDNQAPIIPYMDRTL